VDATQFTVLAVLVRVERVQLVGVALFALDRPFLDRDQVAVLEHVVSAGDQLLALVGDFQP